ncbi:MAG: hypothetical protein HY231_11360 [Acidobacteria bacterium]|nr:hypothetical protein [Acidobacteriota bacterium]
MNWTDGDVAAFLLARSIGLMKSDIPFATNTKHIFWANHSVGSFLFQMLDEMVKLEILEKRDDPDIQYRWNQSYLGTWDWEQYKQD